MKVSLQDMDALQRIPHEECVNLFFMWVRAEAGTKPSIAAMD
jgi:hypothetical protein